MLELSDQQIQSKLFSDRALTLEAALDTTISMECAVLPEMTEMGQLYMN